MMKKWNKKTVVFWLSLILLIVLGIWILWGNLTIGTTEYTIISNRIPEGFDGFRIVQISDLHNAQYGIDNSRLLKQLSGTNPDIIVITGDMVDSRRTNFEIALAFAKEVLSYAPVYYVPGNHEGRLSEYEAFKTDLEDAGVTVLANQKMQFVHNGSSITLMGMNDPRFREDFPFGDEVAYARQTLSALCGDADGYRILLSHRPELFDLYTDHEIDLVFSGHAHGGQFRLPVVGGLIAPNQGFFPKYDAGLFSENHTTMIVSRGIGHSVLPIRINNRPEIVVATLKTSK